MSSLEAELETGVKLILFLYGVPKTKKTWWAGTAAEAGFNTHFINFEPSGTNVLKNLSSEAKSRVNVINATNDHDKFQSVEFIDKFIRGKPFAWDQKQKIAITNRSNYHENRDYHHIDISKLTLNDTLVIDSYTQLANTILFKSAIDRGIDLSNSDNVGDFGPYGHAGNFLNWVLNGLTSLPCHIIVIGHQDQYDKTRTSTDPNGRKIQEIEWTRLQPKSSSGKHAMQIAAKFSDILYFRKLQDMVRIDTRNAHDRDGGGRIIPPKQYSWEELSFKKVCELGGVLMPQNAPPSEAIKYYPIGETIKELGDAPSISKLISPKPISAEEPAKSMGLAALLKKKIIE